MRALVQERKKAVELRKKGYSYNDIKMELGLAKSTLSGWLKDLPLTKEEKESLKSRRDNNISRGRIKTAAALRRNRLEREKKIFLEAKRDFIKFSKEPLFQVGVALYWAEGAKRNSYFSFNNSDPKMIQLMVSWIERFVEADLANLKVSLYIHKPYANENLEDYWSKVIGVPKDRFGKTVYKPTGLLVKKRPNYKGCLRISITRKRELLRVIAWKDCLVRHYI